MNKMEPVDLGFLAGIFEGEGWIVTNKRCGASLNIAMTDFDVIERLYNQSGIGRLDKPRATKSGKKLQLKWTVAKQAELTELLNTILPLLGERRSIRVQEALDMLENQRIARELRKIYYVCGHLKIEENTYHTNQGKTICRECSLNRPKNRKRKRKGGGG